MYSQMIAMSKPGVPVEWTVQRLPAGGGIAHDRWEVSGHNGHETILYMVLATAELVDLQAEITASLNEEMTTMGDES